MTGEERMLSKSATLLLLLTLMAIQGSGDEAVLDAVRLLEACDFVMPGFTIFLVPRVDSRVSYFNFLKRFNSTAKVISFEDARGHRFDHANQENVYADLRGASPANTKAFLERNGKYLGIHKPVVFILSSVKDSDLFELTSWKINQQVFVMYPEEGFLSESYTVGGRQITDRLLNFNLGTGTCRRVSGVESSFLARRSNFHGATLDVLVERQAPYMSISSPAEGTERPRVFLDGAYYEAIEQENLDGLFQEVTVSS